MVMSSSRILFLHRGLLPKSTPLSAAMSFVGGWVHPVAKKLSVGRAMCLRTRIGLFSRGGTEPGPGGALGCG